MRYLCAGEVLQRDRGAAVHILVLVLRGPVDDLDLVVVHQNAPGHRALALAVVLRRTEHRKHTTKYANKEKVK